MTLLFRGEPLRFSFIAANTTGTRPRTIKVDSNFPFNPAPERGEEKHQLRFFSQLILSIFQNLYKISLKFKKKSEAFLKDYREDWTGGEPHQFERNKV